MAFATLNCVNGFLWYLARGARRKFCICNSGAHRAEKNFCNAGLGHPFSLASDARSGEKILQRWSRSPVRSDWVTRFLWYLARAARRKFYFCNLGARSVDLSYHWVSADLKNTKVEPCICRKHNGRATKNLQKVFFGIFLQKPDVRAYFFF